LPVDSQLNALNRRLANEEQPPIRPAATILIVRDAQEGIEVLTLKRAKHMRFLPGFIAFPGGAVSPSDVNLADQHRVVGEIVASERADDVVHAVAALRECAEEIAWLCCLTETVVGGAQKTVSDRALSKAEQQALLDADGGFGELLGTYRIDANRLRFVGRWVTPKEMPARFDTRFFVYVATSFNLPVHVHASELEWAKWANPAKVLAAIERGEEEAVPPTRAMLNALSKMTNADMCMKALSVPGPQSAI
jgi:8-oxo-dGTP pyrophosphatase MutT (NUDIX family)